MTSLSRQAASVLVGVVMVGMVSFAGCSPRVTAPNRPSAEQKTCLPQKRLWQYVHIFGAEDPSYKEKRDRVIQSANVTSIEQQAISKSIGQAYDTVARKAPQWIGMQPGAGTEPDSAMAEQAVRTMEQEIETLLGPRFRPFQSMIDTLEPCD